MGSTKGEQFVIDAYYLIEILGHLVLLDICVMIGVVVKEGEAIDIALRRLKRECINAELQTEVKKHEYYEKPSERRKRKRESAMRKRVKRRSSFRR